jgi:hypothetical protein
MASVPKTTAIAPAAPTTASRSVGPAARIASVSTAQVDAPEISANISFDSATSGFQEDQLRQQLGDQRGREQQRYPEPGVNRLFTADSQDFARIFQVDDDAGRGRQNRDETSRRIDAPRSKIISTYETNALVVSGQQPVRGTSMSFSL